MKKILPVAVLAALAGVNAAQAVHVNSDGLGQVLLYPFYTTESLQDTYINLVNTTDEYKAVKIRILESMNSREVLDFNLYLSPWDHWSATITADGPDAVATLTSADTSCTVPNAVSNGATIEFRTFEFDGSRAGSAADSVAGVERTREGYVEVIEMGIVTDEVLKALIKHTDGTPPGCATLDARWAEGGAWRTDPTDGLSAVSGGLYGYGVLIDVPRGTEASYDATSIDNWAIPGSIVHTAPGSTSPSIGSNADTFYDVFDEGGVVSGEAGDGWDAVSAVLMHATLSNDFVLEPDIDGATDWVVTFPTKREYVNGAGAPAAPFTDAWDGTTSTACETFAIRYWDREEGEPVDPIDPNDFSPLPTAGIVPTFSFCHEANVLTFNDGSVLSASDRTGVNLDLEEGFDNGWARINFVSELPGVRELNTFTDTFFGLPAIGFAVQRYVNGDVLSDLPVPCADDVCADTPTVRANYAGTVTHKGDRLITTPAVTPPTPPGS